jgi:prevent-host-death family protein
MEATFETLDVTIAQRSLADVHERVVKGTGRIELTRDGCDDAVVVISKAELDALERALEILADTDAVRAMRATLARVVTLYERCEGDEDEAVSLHLAEIRTRLMTGAQH